MLFDPGLWLITVGLWLAVAALVRIGGGRLVAAFWPHRPGQAWVLLATARRGIRRLRRHGWSGRHGLPGGLVKAVQAGLCRVAELEEIAPRPEVPDVDAPPLKTGAEKAEVAEMHAIVEEQRAEKAAAEVRLADGETWLDRAEQLASSVDSAFDALAARVDSVFDQIAASALYDALGATGEYPIVREEVPV